MGQDAVASDVHIVVGKPPIMRVDGELEMIEGYDQIITSEMAMELVKSMLTEVQLERFLQDREIDMSYNLEGGTRFRVNCHFEREYPGIVARVIPEIIPTMEDVHLPEITHQLTNLEQGIILLTGPTGCGKSTSLAAMISKINDERGVHIITLEDPIEFLYRPNKAIIRQRQYGTDFLSFSEALRRILRQDPDVILVGEMRDFETISAALTLAETGHLVLATLHTNSAVQTIERIIDVFPPHQQSQVRMQLSMTLAAVIAQRLVPRKGGGRIALREVMFNTPAVANIIRDNRIPELNSVIQTSAEAGMITNKRDAERLVKEVLMDEGEAERYMGDLKSIKATKPAKNKGFFG